MSINNPFHSIRFATNNRIRLPTTIFISTLQLRGCVAPVQFIANKWPQYPLRCYIVAIKCIFYYLLDAVILKMHLSSNLSGSLDICLYLVPTIVSFPGYKTTNHKLSNVCSMQTYTHTCCGVQSVYSYFSAASRGSIISSQGCLLHPGDNIYTKNTNPFWNMFSSDNIHISYYRI